MSHGLPVGRSVVGVDGCKGGWIAVRLAHDGTADIFVTPSFAEILDRSAGSIIAVDMPIGLPERIGPNGRGPEAAVRAVLGPRKRSVFSVPSRSTVREHDYRSACAEAARTSTPSRMVSQQAFHLFPKIRELDGLMTPALESRVHEVHPELAFWRLNGGCAMAHPKKSPAGKQEHIALLLRRGIPETALAVVQRGAGLDDLLDAAASALIARRIARGEAVSFPAEPERDGRGLRMAIWA